MKRNTMKKFTGFCALALGLSFAAGGVGADMIRASANIASTLDTNKKYETTYDNMEECIQAGLDLNEQIAAEGFVLLKNEDALPLTRQENKVTVLGEHADEPSIGGGGSGGQSRPNVVGGNSPAGAQATSIFEGLEAAGIKYNTRVQERYKTANPVTFSVPGSFGSLYREEGHYMEKVDAATPGATEFAGNYYKPLKSGGTLSGADTSISVYNDAAIVLLSRTGSEGADAPARDVPGHSDITDHYMELNDSEKELMAYAKANFKKVIVVLNTPSAMEIQDIQDDEAFGAIIWVGQPGWNGLAVLGKILTGEINPSGRLVDLWAKKFESDPTWYNSGNYSQADFIVNGDTAISGSNTIQLGTNPENETASDSNDRVIDYAEGIYAGYRYYETVATDLGAAGEAWYKDNVTYSFGAGLSYTTFSQKITKVTGDLNKADGKITVEVKVTNTGKVPGKEVVQLYKTSPYTAGGIEKAAIDLVGFAKTGMLKAGASETVTIDVDVKTFASFDYNDANKNGNSGFELEKGDYTLSIRANSHDVLDTYKLTAGDLLTWDEDGNPDTPNNIYSQAEGPWEMFNTLSNHWTESHEDHYLKRSQLVKDGKAADLSKQLAWLVADRDEETGTGKDNVFTEEALMVMHNQRAEAAYEDTDNKLTAEIEDDYKNVWTKTEADIPASWTQGKGQIQADTGRYAIELYDMVGVPLSDPMWDTFMNQLTYAELSTLARNSGSYQTVGLDSVGKPRVVDQDGPGQLKNSSVGVGMAWACEVVVASTWNVDLAYAQGQICGNESMLLDMFGWYGPAMNNHRNPLSGRNFEYYSQDGIQGGIIAAAVIKGATDMGCHVYAKHAFMNDQETNRMNTATFATEQAIREIYARPFEYSIKYGNANGTMTAFNHVGLASSLSYATNIQLYENEWGFDGYSCTDMYTGQAQAYWNMNQLLRGNTIALGTGSPAVEGTWNAEDNCVMIADKDGNQVASPTQWYVVRTLAQRILYVTANGNAMDNGIASYMIKTEQQLKVDSAASGNILSAAALADLQKVFGDAGYTVSATGLPAGVKVSATGAISGTPTTAGNYNVNVTVKGLNGMTYVSTSKTLPLTVAAVVYEDVNFGGASALTLNAPYSATASQDKVVFTADNYAPNGAANAANAGKYTAAVWSAEGLPTGLAIDPATGVISGSAKEVGTFKVTVTETLTKVTSVTTYDSSNRPQTSYAYGTEVIKNNQIVLDVTGGANVTITSNNKNASSDTILRGVAGTTTVSELVAYANENMDKVAGWVVTGFTKDGVALAADATVNAGDKLVAVWQMPDVAVVDGVWYVNGESTGLPVAGQVGPQGPQGAPGKDGVDGIDGINGLDGKDGINGTNGKDGATGATGATGAAGAPGAAGAAGKDAVGGAAPIILSSVACAAAVAAVAVAVVKGKKKD